VESLEELRARIGTAENLRSVVKTMKGLAAISIRHFQDAVDSLADYHRAIELGLQVALRHGPYELSLEQPTGRGRVAAAVVGSDQSMCGQFNEHIAEHVAHDLARLGVERDRRVILAIGLRVTFPLELAGIQLDEVFSVPASLSGLCPLVQDVLLQIDEWHEELGVDSLLVYHNRPTSRASYHPHTRHLLPVDVRWLAALKEREWEGRTLPIFTADWGTLFSALIRQHLLVSVYRSIVESLAAENASRLASMQAAERNIEERVQELRSQFHRQRQVSITAELLDIVGGLEALGGTVE
jgi:F-type H+-transporting ATPase subunit gamma